MTNPVALGGIARTLAVSTSASKTSTPLEPGVYDLWCDVDVFITAGTDPLNTAITTANGYKIFAGNVIPVRISSSSFLHAIAGVSGTLSYYKTGA